MPGALVQSIQTLSVRLLVFLLDKKMFSRAHRVSSSLRIYTYSNSPLFESIYDRIKPDHPSSTSMFCVAQSWNPHGTEYHICFYRWIYIYIYHWIMQLTETVIYICITHCLDHCRRCDSPWNDRARRAAVSADYVPSFSSLNGLYRWHASILQVEIAPCSWYCDSDITAFTCECDKYHSWALVNGCTSFMFTCVYCPRRYEDDGGDDNDGYKYGEHDIQMRSYFIDLSIDNDR